MAKGLKNRRVIGEDVAKLAQVSRSAVSRTFTAGASVAPDTRVRVMAAATALGYRQAASAPDADPRQMRPIAVIMANLLSPYFAELSDRLNAELVSREMRALFFVSSDPETLDALMQSALSYDVRGFILFSAVPSPKTLAAAKAANLPIVILNRNDQVEGASLVWIDGPEIGRSIAQLMLGEGRSRPVALAATPQRSRELASFADGMEAGGSQPCRWIQAGWHYEDGLRAAERLCLKNDVPDAIFAASDALAIGVLDGIRAIGGIEIPADLSIVGFGDTAPSRWISHQVSTVRIPIVSLIQTAVSTLIARIRSVEEPAPRIWLSCDIIERDTTQGLGRL